MVPKAPEANKNQAKSHGLNYYFFDLQKGLKCYKAQGEICSISMANLRPKTDKNIKY